MLLDILVRGLVNGSLYGLVAVSFNILYRPTNVFNFAQGDLVMLGAMVAATAATTRGLPWIVVLPATALVVGLIGLLTERIAVSPILSRSVHGQGWIISTLAVSLIVANSVGFIWGPDPIRVLPPGLISTEPFLLLGARISAYQIFLILLTPMLVFAVERFYRTLGGKAVMAVAEDRDGSLLRGINPRKLSQWSFFLGGAFAGMIGLLAAPIRYASTSLGPMLLLQGFAAVAIGGVGSNRGALLAAYILGIAEAAGARALTPGYQEAVTFVLMMVILMARPMGLFGRSDARTV